MTRDMWRRFLRRATPSERWLEELRRSVRRPAAVGRVVPGRPTDDPARSCLGRISMLGRGESWPLAEGRPMAGLAQLNLTESPHVPTELRGIALINIWLAASDDELVFPDERPNGDGWELRAYESLDDLVPAEGRVLEWLRPGRLDWELIDDYPDWEDLGDALSEEQIAEIDEEVHDAIGHAASGTKLGGWPSLIQHEISWAPWNQHPASPRYCLQIDSDQDANLNLWDRGVLHIGLGSLDARRTWVAETQFM